MKRGILALCAVGLLAFAGFAHADQIEVFTGSQAGYCCFNVQLDQKSTTDVQVTVTLTDGAQYFVATGNGKADPNHPGFAMNLDVFGYPAVPPATNPVSISGLSSPWALSGVAYASDSTGGPAMGTFDLYLLNPGKGANAHNAGPLSFDVIDAAGISLSDFVKSSNPNGGYYFEADILDADCKTGESGISTGPTTPSPIPEPSALLLLGSGMLAAALFLRRRLA